MPFLPTVRLCRSTCHQVRQCLSDFGEISNVRLIRDTVTGAVKGFGYVRFGDSSSVSLALRASGTVAIRGRAVRIHEWKADGAGGQSGRSRQRSTGRQVPPDAARTNSGPVAPMMMTNTKRRDKVWHKLEHSNKAKGITLPSNLRHTERVQFLERRLMKKRKRQIRRQQQQNEGKSSVKTKTTSSLSKRKRS